jgi:hypothetical protein
MTVGWLKCYTGYTAVVELSQEIPVAEPYKYSPSLRPRNEETPAAASPRKKKRRLRRSELRLSLRLRLRHRLVNEANPSANPKTHILGG